MRYLVLSDVHANLAALEAVLADAGAVDGIWCLGDLVGYGPDPNECVERLRPLVEMCVAGNHDWACIGKLDISDFNADAQRACCWTQRALSPASCAYLEMLPQILIQGDYTLAHGSPRYPIWEYLFHSLDARENLAYFQTPYCFVGHTHMPLMFRLDDDTVETIVPTPDGEYSISAGRWIINPGAVGQPRDGDERASYLVLDTAELTVTFHRVAYSIEETQQRMTEAGLPPRLVARLSYGW